MPGQTAISAASGPAAQAPITYARRALTSVTEME